MRKFSPIATLIDPSIPRTLRLLEEENKTLKSEVEELRVSRDAYRDKTGELLKKCEDIQSVNVALQATNEELVNSREAQSKVFHETLEESRLLTGANADLQSQIDELKGTIDTLSKHKNRVILPDEWDMIERKRQADEDYLLDNLKGGTEK